VRSDWRTRRREMPDATCERGHPDRQDDLEDYIERQVDEWMLAESVARLDDPDAEFMSLDEVKAELGL
jgi:hypothetical protein